MPHFPLPYPELPDPRFSWPLIQDVSEVLVSHGFPDAMDNAQDGCSLQALLFLFLYGPVPGGES